MVSLFIYVSDKGSLSLDIIRKKVVSIDCGTVSANQT